MIHMAKVYGSLVNAQFRILESADKTEFLVVLMIKRGDTLREEVTIQPKQIEILYHEIQKQKLLGKVPGTA